MTMTTTATPRETAMIRELHAAAGDAGFEDRIWGALVIAAKALADLETRVSIDLRKVAGRGDD